MPGVGRTPVVNTSPPEESALDHGAGQPRVASHDQTHFGQPVMLEQGGHQLAAETEGELRRQRLLIGEAADAVRAEEAPHQRSWAKPTRTTEGVIRTTLTPGGTMIRSGARPTTTSPGREPARLMRTRRASGATRKSAERSPWSWTSTVSGRSLVTMSPDGTPSSSTGRGRVTLVFSELITKTQRAAEKARASSLSSQWCT